MNKRLLLPLLAMILATLACSLIADAPTTPTAEPEPIIRITQQPTRTPLPVITEDPADDNDDDGGGSGSGSGNNSGNYYLPACTPRYDWTNYYTVVSGDTLAGIARQANTTYQTIAQGNCLGNPNAIEVGQVLRLPNPIVVPQPQPVIFIDNPADIQISTSGGVTVYGRTQNVPAGSQVKVQLLNGNGALVREQFTSTNGNYALQLTVGSVSGYPGANNDGAPAQIRTYAYNNSGDVLASTGKSVFLRTNDTIDPRVTLDIDDVSVDEGAKRVTARGNGGRGLFEGNVVVRILDANGTTLKEQATTVVYSGNSGDGEWSIAFDVNNLTTLGQGRVYAFAPSPKDGSVMVSDTADVSFDFTPPQPDVSVSISLDEYDYVITPKADGSFLVRGSISNPGTYNTINVSVRDTSGSPISGTARSTQVDASGVWHIDMQVPSSVRGTHQVYAYVTTGGGAVVADAVKSVVFAENLGAMSRTYSANRFAYTYPDGWYSYIVHGQGTNGIDHPAVSTFPQNGYPPGAAWDENTASVEFYNEPADENTTLEQRVEAYKSAFPSGAVNPQFQQEAFTFSDGRTGIHLWFVGGTGKTVHVVFSEVNGAFVGAEAQGNWELGRAVVRTLRAG